ncbi:glycosyltransferase [Methylobacterium radiotolerans]|jgi:glycosyltransferase involved in cell wall biosynthesis|uniref:glycosyltransferase n=1 Tax=Methylobacterium TaxID=407 RepID=UPI0003FA5658|nr:MULTISPECIES: glycosyltransferase [Methylobacterium]GAN48537.1 putative glycosyl transferase [Methylobacterium sp. ME121]KTS08095.1 cellobiosyl-diphosphoprenyl alpha-mannosyltransferase [Methylobacterium radiotolerans]KTS51000.1 cellobiosyl-diphosphoprenyl alpha-mannosyltransferase [Methylobacterium radiotolerans]MBN6820953.1 glycosyltransferase [Methylobacterium organophilum]OXE38891.1 alpha-mannosyltransferase [Methylobacterium radiotolerans]
MPAGNREKFQILYLQPGTSVFAGIERVVDTIGAELAATCGTEFAIDVLRVTQHENYPAEPRHYRSIFRPVTSRLHLMRIFRDVSKGGRYDLIIVPQIEPTVVFWLARVGIPQRITMHLHGNPRRESGSLKSKIKFFFLKYYVLPRITSVFGTSPRQLRAFEADFKCRRPMYWVPNPVRHFEAPGEDIRPDPAVITFVNVGRYAFQKGQDLLIRAFARVYERRRNVRLNLVGHGSDKAALAEQIRALDLSDAVRLIHYPDDPQRALFVSDVFVATSRWEGWSLAICEALRCGLPVISTDCEFGPSDILVDQRLGRLVAPDDEDGLVRAMEYYCDNIEPERSFSDFRKDYIDQYSAEKVVHIHADAIRQSAC